MEKEVIKHLKGDMKDFKKEASQDRKLIKKLKKDERKDKKEDKKKPRKVSKGKKKIERVMKEYKSKTLHAGSKKGPVVKKRSQALAIALSEAKRAKKKK